MDKYRHTDDNHEFDDVSQLILELKDLTAEQYRNDDNRPARKNQEDISLDYEDMAEEDDAVSAEELALPAMPKVRKKSGVLPIWMVALINILVGGVVILTFALFHHVLPAVMSEQARKDAMLHATEAPIVVPVDPAETPVETPAEQATEMPTEPDTRTEWQKKFEEHFSDEIIRTENSYKSPNVSITVETITYGEGKKKQTYHIADIYVGSIDNFTTYVAGGDGTYFSKEHVEEMSKASDALIAICGDFITLQRGGFLVRNRDVVYETTNADSICVLFPDGTIETYEGREYSIDEIKSRDPLQVWSFGPTLLDENGKVRTKYNMPRAVSYPNPRSAIGYYEPGHYCFLVADGRQDGYAKGLSIPELAQIFEDLGCTRAYNLDGGGSAVMTFNHKMYSKQSNGGRELGDILLIRETPEFLASMSAVAPAGEESSETAPMETTAPDMIAEAGMTESEEGIG